MLRQQAEAWNAGDLERFMDGHERTASPRFATGGQVTYGWQETLERYRRRYPDRGAMAALEFHDLEITTLASDTAIAFGRWRLRTDTSEPNGLFTLVFRQTPAGWRIVADRTSAAP